MATVIDGKATSEAVRGRVASQVAEFVAQAGHTPRLVTIPVGGGGAVVVGRSDIVGKPVALLLLHENATVTIAHSRTRDLAGVTRRADILVAAVGRPEMITGEMVKPGATVIDVGVNRTDAGLVGDVHYPSASQVAGAITPVPGGVGPMTIAMLLANTLKAA